MRLLDIAGNETREGDLVATSLPAGQGTSLRVGTLEEIVWHTEPFKVWRTAYNASPEHPVPVLKILYPTHTRTTSLIGQPHNFVRINKEA